MPGIFTGFTAIITAISALVALLVQIGLFDVKAQKDNPSIVQVKSVKSLICELSLTADRWHKYLQVHDQKGLGDSMENVINLSSLIEQKVLEKREIRYQVRDLQSCMLKYKENGSCNIRQTIDDLSKVAKCSEDSSNLVK